VRASCYSVLVSVLTLLYRFRWVFCQLDALQHCFPPNLRQYLNELPETLDETYERILKGINKAQKDNAHRLLQCLTVAVRPLLVEELAELLAFDFQASTAGGIPTLKEDWRWDDEEEAVLSTCSSLIAIIPRGDSRVVQFSHFSVKEYLTSSRLAQSPHGDVSRFRIDLEPAHTIMAQACLATLLRLDEHAGKVMPKCLLWSNTPLNTGWTMPNSRRCHHGYGMGWMIYLTAPSHISQRGSGCTTLTNAGNFLALFARWCWFPALLCCILWVL
jgi:hypothetical protein